MQLSPCTYLHAVCVLQAAERARAREQEATDKARAADAARQVRCVGVNRDADPRFLECVRTAPLAAGLSPSGRGRGGGGAAARAGGREGSRRARGSGGGICAV